MKKREWNKIIKSKFGNTGDSLKNRMKKNSLTSIIFFVVTLPLMFIITPMILKTVGKEIYGIWVLTGTIILFLEYVGLQNNALNILVPKYDAEKQPEKINALLNTVFAISLIFGAVFSLLFLFMQDSIIALFFKVDTELIRIVKFVLSVTFYIFIINFVFVSIAFLLGGFNMFYIYNITHIITGFVRFGFFIFVLMQGFGIKGIVIVQMSSIILETLVFLIISKKVFPPLKINPFSIDKKAFKEVFSLWSKIFFSRFSEFVNYNIDKLILGYFINPVMVAYYQIGDSVTKYISRLPEIMGFGSVVPAAAELKAKKQMEKIFTMYDRTNKYTFFIALLLVSGIIIFGKEFIFLWLGKGYEIVYMVFLFLSISHAISLVGYPAMRLLNGIERVNETMMASAVTAAINTVLSIFLTMKYGIYGALSGTFISILIGTVIIYIFYLRYFKHPFNIRLILLKPVVSLAVAFIVTCFVGYLFPQYGWIGLSIKVITYTLVYGTMTIIVFKHFDEYDMDIVRSIFPRK